MVLHVSCQRASMVAGSGSGSSTNGKVYRTLLSKASGSFCRRILSR